MLVMKIFPPHAEDDRVEADGSRRSETMLQSRVPGVQHSPMAFPFPCVIQILIIKVGEAFDERTFRQPGAVGESLQCLSKKVRLAIRRKNGRQNLCRDFVSRLESRVEKHKKHDRKRGACFCL